MIPPGVLVSDSYRDSVNKEPIVLFPNRDTLLDKVDNDRDIIHYGLFRSMKAICEIKKASSSSPYSDLAEERILRRGEISEETESEGGG